ncbi:hypothetical protein [Streptosporangium sp. LJ11]|uniref:hypothetical protein n=1 Tax=Streptosporangium sp. LJ11 TaxID=3436927 RepID=UPI003F7A804D
MPGGSRPDLTPAAIARSADDLRARAEAEFSASGTPLERISAYPGRERDAPRGARWAASPRTRT